MRVTNEMMVSNSLHRLSSRLQQFERTQSQLSTGRRMLAPSDDPGGSGRALSLRATQRARQQEARNASDAQGQLALADNQLQASVNRLHRARDLTVAGASSVSPQQRNAMAVEIRAIQDELVGIANTRNRGRPLFSGYRDVSAVAKGAADEWIYQGDDGAVTRRVGEQDLVTVNVTAAEVFGFGAPDGDVFSLLDDIILALDAGDTDEMSAALGRLDEAQRRIGDAQTKIGASANWVESAQLRTQDSLLAIRTQLSEVEDINIAEGIMELQLQENAYQVTLQAMARALPPSLASFLR